jgi:hypothetical protein
MKIIYRWIFRGDGEYQESVDYRSSSSLPAGGTPVLAAIGVTFSPSGNISSTNVQSALEELDNEELTSISGILPITVSGTVISHAISGATAGTYGQTTVDVLGHVTGGGIDIIAAQRSWFL